MSTIAEAEGFDMLRWRESLRKSCYETKDVKVINGIAEDFVDMVRQRALSQPPLLAYLAAISEQEQFKNSTNRGFEDSRLRGFALTHVHTVVSMVFSSTGALS